MTGRRSSIWGCPAGILLMLGDKTVYHAGDTGLFSDMKLIGERHPVDIAMLPIGDNFTMGPEDARPRRRVRAKWVIPMHYNTFPLIDRMRERSVRNLEAKGIKRRDHGERRNEEMVGNKRQRTGIPCNFRVIRFVIYYRNENPYLETVDLTVIIFREKVIRPSPAQGDFRLKDQPVFCIKAGACTNDGYRMGGSTCGGEVMNRIVRWPWACC